MEAPLPEKLRGWLAREGYPFELQMGRVLREAGWQVFHGRHYADQETGKLREMDLHAAWGPYVGDQDDLGMVGLGLVCECKVSEDKPWVVFTSGESDSVDRLAGHLAPGQLPARALAHAAVTNRGRLRAFNPAARIGHGITKAFTDSKAGDPTGPFSAVMAAVAAATALSRDFCSMILKHGQRDESWIEIYVPVVILKGLLFEFYLDEAGHETLQECDRCHILAHCPDSGDRVLVQIVAAHAMPTFAAAALEDSKIVAKSVKPEARAMWASYRDLGMS